jgi:ArsR family transcriptional regulator
MEGTTLVATVNVANSNEQWVALADPTRLAILDLLRGRDHCVCHLVDQLGLKQSIISHHVGILRRAGLISSYPHPADRRWLYYRLDRDALTAVASHLQWLLDGSDYDPTPLPCRVDADSTSA